MGDCFVFSLLLRQPNQDVNGAWCGSLALFRTGMIPAHRRHMTGRPELKVLQAEFEIKVLRQPVRAQSRCNPEVELMAADQRPC